VYIKREAEKKIAESVRFFPVIAILGPRQSGKTTLARHLFPNHVYVSLEEVDKRLAAQQDPRSFLTLHRNNHGLLIDEFQYAPDLLSYVQTIVDQEQVQGQFILTGSQNFLMNQAISQSLAGRVSLHTLLPFSLKELKDQTLLPMEMERALYQGQYPAIYTKRVAPQDLYRNYIKTYIERDVRQLAHVGDLKAFQTLLVLCAERVGQLVNFSELGKEAGISDQTVRRWLTILEASYILFFLQPFEKTLGKRLIKTPKLYFYDPGLVSHLLQLTQHDLIDHPKKGNIFEAMIVSEIRKYFYNHGFEPTTFFWQDHNKHEVDCIVAHKNAIFALEIKASRTPNKNFFSGLSYWRSIIKKPPPSKQNEWVVYGGDSRHISGFNNVVSWQVMESILDFLPY
jgi:predicted AAA+ superfamily ATPase